MLDGARCWGVHSLAGTLRLAGKGLAWDIQPGDTGSPAADTHLDLAVKGITGHGMASRDCLAVSKKAQGQRP